MTLVGAYGRDYNSKKAVEEDLLKNNKDFKIAESGQYTSGKELKSMGHTQVKVRYSKLRKSAYIDL